MKAFEVLMHEDEDGYDARQVLRVIHHGKVLEEHYDGGEPEDNSFTRDWSWVPAAIEKAYALGVEDAHRSHCEAAAGAKSPDLASNPAETK